MSEDRIIQRIVEGTVSRSDRLKIYENAKASLNAGKNVERAEAIIDAIQMVSVPPDQSEFVFMGYCPGASLENRQDEKWIADGICEFDWITDPIQTKRFYEIQVGETIIAKKREEFGETMMISAHGKVVKREESQITGKLYFRVDWTVPEEFLIVPLLGCNSTVNVRTREDLEDSMPLEFWEWLKTEN